MKPMLFPSVAGIMLALVIGVTGGAAASDKGPEEAKLDRISKLFDGVIFDHAAHVDIAGDCATCHHHTTGDGAGGERCSRCHAQSPKSDKVACHSCHDVNQFTAAQLERKDEDRFRYHIDRPGLKAAYHWNCLGCHADAGGPMGCEDCHARNETGDEFYHAGAFAPQTSATHPH